VWDDAAKWLNKFGEAVLTVIDTNGYPANVRVLTSGYDRASGELAVSLPAEIDGANGPASLLCHSHDEKLWSLQMITINGTVQQRDGAWIFRTESFTPPSKLAVLDFIRNASRSAQKYLDKRGLPRPQVNWAEVKEVQRRAKAARTAKT
jgi:hypothetical protein